MAVDQIQLKKPEVIRSSGDTARSFRDLARRYSESWLVPLEENAERRARPSYDTAENFVSRLAYLMPANVKV